MDEYVTKDTLKETLIDWSCNASYIEVETKWALEEIKNIPAADVAPVIHGILKYSPQDDIALCSKCGEEIYLGALHQFAHNYCPNCGAKMDGE